ncbi:MAG: tetratricopeptide repeat protein [Polyangia bacterium]
MVSRNALWLRRFFLIFGAALLMAIAFNIYMTRRLDVEATAGKEQEPVASGSVLPPADQARLPQDSPARVANSAPAVTVSPGVPPAARLSRGTEPSGSTAPLARLSRPAVTTIAAPASTAPAASDLPADRMRPRAAGDGKKALSEARAAFERDDFSRAILEGRAALAAGEGGAHAILGAAYFKLGRFEDAVREYGEALRLDPANPVLARRVEIARRAASRRAEGGSP